MSAINPYIPVYDPKDNLPFLGLRQFIKGYFDTSGRQYKVIGKEDAKTLIMEEQKPSSPYRAAYKTAALFTLFIPVLALIWLAYNQLTCQSTYKIKPNQSIQRGHPQTTIETTPPTHETTPIPSHTRAEMLKDSHAIQEQFEAIFNQLSELRGEKGRQLRTMLATFQVNYDDYLNCLDEKAIVNFTYVNETFEGLCRLNHALFNTKRPENPLKDSVVQMPGDGACLFHSLSAGIKFSLATLR